MDALEVRGFFLGKGKLRGERVGGVEGEWRVAGVLERHGVEDGHGSRAPLDRCEEVVRLNLVHPRICVLELHEDLGGHVGDNELAEAGARALLSTVRFEVRCARLLDARNLGVGGGPGEIDGARVDGFGLACPAGACGVHGNGFEQVGVFVVLVADGGRRPRAALTMDRLNIWKVSRL